MTVHEFDRVASRGAGPEAQRSSPSSVLGATASSGLREQKKQRTRRSLHDAARRLVLAHGLQAAPVGEICRDADVSPRTFFNYFPSKAAAALGLPQVPSDLADFMPRDPAEQGRGDLRWICSVVGAALDSAGAGQVGEPAEVRALLQARPELLPELHGWLAAVRGDLIEVLEGTIGLRRAQLLTAVAFAALAAELERTDDPAGSTTERLAEALQEVDDALGAGSRD